ncbi:RNA-binding protein [Candidatus Roizmanbacteria bacterium]|jgi:RNA recognition motif-containing protein|nr:RNA-binding protein [Candidatus Roizmanbacteria bacterium]
MNKKLYVGNLLYEVTDEDLKDLFSQAGNVVSAAIIRFHDTGRSKGFGFVEMETEEGAQKAIETLNEKDFKGRKMLVSEARPPKPRGNFGDRPQRNFDN